MNYPLPDKLSFPKAPVYMAVPEYSKRVQLLKEKRLLFGFDQNEPQVISASIKNSDSSHTCFAPQNGTTLKVELIHKDYSMVLLSLSDGTSIVFNNKTIKGLE